MSDRELQSRLESRLRSSDVLQALAHRLPAEAPPLRVVGGFLRDLALGRPTADLDLAVDCPIEAAEDLARHLAEGTPTHRLGRAPRAILAMPGVRLAGKRVDAELWPLGDIDTQADLRRRELSINALAWTLPDGPLIDQVGAIADLEAKRLRAHWLGTYEDDPVRVLRLARFTAQLPDFEIDPETLTAAAASASGLAKAPRERFGRELGKLIAAPAPERGAFFLIELGIAEVLGLHPDVEGLAHLSDLRRRACFAKGKQLATLALVVGRSARLEGMALPRDLTRSFQRLPALVEAVGRTESSGDRRELVAAAGELLPAALCLALAEGASFDYRALWACYRRYAGELADRAPLLDGHEIQSHLELSPGAELGRAIDALRLAQIRGEVRSVASARRWLLAWTAGSLPAS